MTYSYRYITLESLDGKNILWDSTDDYLIYDPVCFLCDLAESTGVLLGLC